MKKIGVVIILLFLSSTVFALDFIGSLYVRVYPNEPATYDYEFFSVDLRNTSEMLYLGYIIGVYYETHPLNKSGVLLQMQVNENNTELSQEIKNKMRQVGANVCMSSAFKDYLVVNLLMPNGTYTTIIYEPLD